MTTGTISNQASSAREGARKPDGKFGTYSLDEGAEDIDLVVEEPVEEPERAFGDVEGAAFALKKYDTLDDKVKAFKDEIDKAVTALDTDDGWKDWLDMNSRFHHYSFSNQMLILIQSGGKATRVAGFRKWEEFERKVNKGEKAIGILAPKIVNAVEKDANGKPKKGPDGKPIKSRRLVGFSTASVFDVAQTSGKDLPEIERELTETPPEGFVEDMHEAAAKAGYTVEYREMDSFAKGTAQGWTDPTNKKIVIDASMQPGSQAATMAHELGHVYAGHVDPDHPDHGKYHTGEGGCRGRFEVEADSIAYTLQRANGVKPGQSSKLTAQYVAAWSRHDPTALKNSAEAIQKATKKILAAHDFRNLDKD